MKFLKRNKRLLIVIVIFLVGLVSLVQLKAIIFPSGSAIYGNRLDGIEEVQLKDDIAKIIEEKIKEAVSSVSVRTSGRIINIQIVVNDDVSLSSAKNYATKVLEVFSEKELNFYDIQVFVSKKTDAKEFPIIGYKHQNDKEFVWTKDRA